MISTEEFILPDMNHRQLIAWLCLIAVVVASVQGARRMQDWQRARLPIIRQLGKARGGEHPVLDLVVFSDFQCPACSQTTQILHPLLERYPHQVRINFRQFPLERPHRWAMAAAIASECAGLQDRFWTFHDLLYARQATWAASQDAVALFKQYARELNLRLSAFDRCLDQRQTLPMVQQDMKEGERERVSSTPTIIINQGQERFVGSALLHDALPRLEARLRGDVKR